jgi:hypothetical protein
MCVLSYHLITSSRKARRYFIVILSLPPPPLYMCVCGWLCVYVRVRFGYVYVCVCVNSHLTPLNKHNTNTQVLYLANNKIAHITGTYKQREQGRKTNIKIGKREGGREGGKEGREEVGHVGQKARGKKNIIQYYIQPHTYHTFITHIYIYI